MINILYGIEIELIFGMKVDILKNDLNCIEFIFMNKNKEIIFNEKILSEIISKKNDNYFIKINNHQKYKTINKILQNLYKYLKNKIKNIYKITIDNSIRLFPNELDDKNLFLIQLEIISGKINFEELLNFIESVIKLKNEFYISYNDTCGIHISFSTEEIIKYKKIKILDGTIIPNINLLGYLLGNKIDIINKKIRNDKDYYSQDVKSIIKKMINDFILKKYNYNYKILKKIKEIKDFKKSKKILELLNALYLKIYNTKKYQIINIKDYFTSNGRLELRLFTTYYLFNKRELFLKILKYIIKTFIKYNNSYIEKMRVEKIAIKRIKKIIENAKI